MQLLFSRPIWELWAKLLALKLVFALILLFFVVGDWAILATSAWAGRLYRHQFPPILPLGSRRFLCLAGSRSQLLFCSEPILRHAHPWNRSSYLSRLCLEQHHKWSGWGLQILDLHSVLANVCFHEALFEHVMKRLQAWLSLAVQIYLIEQKVQMSFFLRQSWRLRCSPTACLAVEEPEERLKWRRKAWPSTSA